MMGIVLMYFSIEISENVILDLRHLVLIIAALFGDLYLQWLLLCV